MRRGVGSGGPDVNVTIGVGLNQGSSPSAVKAACDSEEVLTQRKHVCTFEES